MGKIFSPHKIVGGTEKSSSFALLLAALFEYCLFGYDAWNWNTQLVTMKKA